MLCYYKYSILLFSMYFLEYHVWIIIQFVLSVCLCLCARKTCDAEDSPPRSSKYVPSSVICLHRQQLANDGSRHRQIVHFSLSFFLSFYEARKRLKAFFKFFNLQRTLDPKNILRSHHSLNVWLDGSWYVGQNLIFPVWGCVCVHLSKLALRCLRSWFIDAIESHAGVGSQTKLGSSSVHC